MQSQLDYYLAEKIESKATNLFRARNDRPQLETFYIYRSAASDNSWSLEISPAVFINSAKGLENAQLVGVLQNYSRDRCQLLTSITTGEQQRMCSDIYDSPPTILDNPEHLLPALPGASANAPYISSFLALDFDVWTEGRGE